MSDTHTDRLKGHYAAASQPALVQLLSQGLIADKLTTDECVSILSATSYQLGDRVPMPSQCGVPPSEPHTQAQYQAAADASLARPTGTQKPEDEVAAMAANILKTYNDSLI